MPARHVMILASAGSGKTYALTHRYLSLLAEGVDPERIVALTFTRKAAGEFFDEILKKLGQAAADPAFGAQLAREIGLADGSAAAYRRLLRRLLAAMPRLRLGTLDAFFARIVLAFPFELGLSGEFEILDGPAARRERRRVMRRMFLRAPAGGVSAVQAQFIEAFKRATFGLEEKALAARLDTYLDQHQEAFLAASLLELWGDSRRIWPDGAAWQDAKAETAPGLRQLRRWAADAELGERQRERWLKFCDAVDAWRPGADLPRELTYVLEKSLARIDDLRAGSAVLEFERKEQRLTAEAALALADVSLAVVAGEFTRRLERTQGIFQVLGHYDAAYHELARRGGKLTFADVQRLLEPVRLASGWDAAAPDRLAIDYRLDGRFDHWLLDEFQDTSFGQWSILENLIDEVVQDPEGRRSFFCVGDVKQSIYTWREGDPRLFREILERYNNAAPGTVEERELTQSWRSGPESIAFVNGVFGAAGVLRELFPGRASEDWIREWRPHGTAVPHRRGQAALLLAPDEAGRWAAALRILKELDPSGRGLTCAVLVQRNQTATDLADFLRAQGGLPAVADSDLAVCADQPLGAALIALVRAAAHPDDSLAWGHVRMSPLGAILAADGLNEPAALSVRVLGQIHADGFGGMAEAWLRRLVAALAPSDAFGRLRARQIGTAARAFDETGSREPDEFLEFMTERTVREPESAGIVRVMTIHKAKGLGFDVVILPDLEGKTLLERRAGLAVKKAADRSVEWILDLPPKLFWERDPVLAAHAEEASCAACFEQLCLLYVALTRAKLGLYAIVEPTGRSESRNFPRLLQASLGERPRPIQVGDAIFSGTWAQGDAHWVRGVAAPPPAAEPPAAPVRVAPARAGIRLTARRPSEDTRAAIGAAAVFRTASAAEAEFGVRLHALLAGIEWADAAQRQEWIARWLGRGDAEDEAAACLGASALAAVWERPAGAAEVWRERAFEAAIGTDWISGHFDRVVVGRDAKGRAAWAIVYDFKTDRIGADPRAAVERHRRQMEWYRQAGASLTGLAPEAVRCELVFTHTRARVPVADPE